MTAAPARPTTALKIDVMSDTDDPPPPIAKAPDATIGNAVFRDLADGGGFDEGGLGAR
eukprot:CAMPEP_0198207120 /NCGR_PEP_ID=MMETSP1445-20131203/10598_1 /TAXON_ID=36898 /ORGANISM="Pyramimonas sp., Strain CCMP2087" /LENGTH=57 /DNA_ID=CAMNT_0043880037 /DNA_START=688 /DNA_END=861 /DNA_ORIENTATION=-